MKNKIYSEDVNLLNSLKHLYSLLDPVQQRQLRTLQVLVILMSLAEVVSVMSIGPFMALVGNLGQIHGEGMVAQAYRWSGVGSATQFVFLVGIISFTVLTTAALISTYTLWRLSNYGTLVGAELGNRLYSHFMARDWLFHASNNSAYLSNKVTQDTQRVTTSIINAFLQLNAKLVMASVMAMAILVYNPFVALIGVGLFSLSYLILYKLVRIRLDKNGRDISQFQAMRFLLLAEGLGGAKDAMLLGRQNTFIQRFKEASHHFATASASNLIISQVPRYAVELLAFGSVIALVLYLTVAHQGDLGTILPVLSVYALAGMKLLPAFQQVYSSLTQIRGGIPALNNIKKDLQAGRSSDSRLTPVYEKGETSHLLPAKCIQLQGVSFQYPDTERLALHELNITIPANKVVGLVGPSGSGKSTAIDILLGLVPPQKGALLVDGEVIKTQNMRAWQNTVGFVAQSIFLTDSTIRDNIAFGLPRKDIDEAKINNAVTIANLNDLLTTLPHGLDTVVGERGVQLSGGQRQRIGIARALYHDAAVLILDEATSALDGIAEKLIMDAVHDFSGKKTIVLVAHRLATVKQCDWIYMLQDGQVVDEGTYESLMQRNATFKKMATHT